MNGKKVTERIKAQSLSYAIELETLFNKVETPLL